MRFLPIRSVLAVMVTTVALAGCSSDSTTDSTGSPAAGDAVDVVIDNFVFDAGTVTISAGETVRWTNDQSVTHTVTSEDELWDATLSSGGTFEFTFVDGGSYSYFCAIHPSMTGTIEVDG